VTTAVATKARSLSIPGLSVVHRQIEAGSSSESHKASCLQLFEGLKTGRKADIEVVKNALSSCDGAFFYKIMDLLAIYRCVLELRDAIPKSRLLVCDNFLNEAEANLKYFYEHHFFREKKIKVEDILR